MKCKKTLMVFLTSFNSIFCISSAKDKNEILKKTSVVVSENTENAENTNKSKDSKFKNKKNDSVKKLNSKSIAIVLLTSLSAVAASSSVTWNITKNYYKDKKYEEIEHTVEKNMLCEMAEEIIYKYWIRDGKSNVSMSDCMDDNKEKLLIKSIDNLVSLGLEIYNLMKPPAMYSKFWSVANNPVNGHKLDFWRHIFSDFIGFALPYWDEIKSSGKKEVAVTEFSVKLFIEDEVLYWEDLKIKQK